MGEKMQSCLRKLVVWITFFIFLLLSYQDVILYNNGQWNWVYYGFVIFSIIMMTWCFIVLLVVDPGKPREGNDQSPFARNQFCLQCKIPKPERCHHCSVCDRCVLQLDHHCPWLNTCIGYHTRKQFILLLSYVIIFLTINGIGVTKFAIKQLLERISWENIFLGLLYSGNIILLILMMSFWKYHIELIVRNRTTLEDVLQKQYCIIFNHYDIGAYKNIVQIFGEHYYLWPLPIKSFQDCDDGHKFIVRMEQQQQKSVQSIPPKFTQLQIHNENRTYDKEEHPKITELHSKMKESKSWADFIKQ